MRLGHRILVLESQSSDLARPGWACRLHPAPRFPTSSDNPPHLPTTLHIESSGLWSRKILRNTNKSRSNSTERSEMKALGVFLVLRMMWGIGVVRLTLFAYMYIYIPNKKPQD